MTRNRFGTGTMTRLVVAALVVIGCVGLGATPARAASSGLVISEYLANPPGDDSPFEYVELVATRAIDFSKTPYSVVFTNNAGTNAAGWVAGGALTYGFSITTGSVARGDVVYVGGSSMVPTGPKLRTINTRLTPGDRFGTPVATGVLGNGGTSADGIGVFAAEIGTLTAASVPVDALFFGSGVGPVAPTGGFELPDNDHYDGGKLRAGVFLGPDPNSGQVVVATGVYDIISGGFTTPRTWAVGAATDRASGITLSGNFPLATICPTLVFATAGSEQTAQVQASDEDGVVGAPQLSVAAPSGITLENAAPAAGAGGRASAIIRIASTVALGDYEVGIAFSNADASPQTAQCAVRVRVLETVHTVYVPVVASQE